MLLTLLACNRSPPVDDTDTVDTDPSVSDGAFCDPAEQVGNVAITRYGTAGSLSVSARIWDKPDPWLGPPTASTDACGFFEYSNCGSCDTGLVCHHDGSCVEPRRARTDVILESSAGNYGPDTTGLMWGYAAVADSYSFRLVQPEGDLVVDALALHEGLVAEVHSGGSYEAPGELAVSWTGADEGHVSTVIPINHHAGAPTFTSCRAEASVGGFDVPADMVNPLSVSTGLEFQGLHHGDYAAVETDAGCIQFGVWTQHQSDVQFSR
jgi:hypothetical protein